MDSWYVKLESWLERKSVRLSLSIVVAAVLVFLAVFADKGVGIDDDWSISVALSGRYPDSGLCLFVNALISQASVALNDALPFMNWFLVIERLITVAAFAAFNYAVLTFLAPVWAFSLMALLEMFALPGCTYVGNFTFVAFVATLAGGSLLLGNVVREGRHVASSVIGIVLCACGYAIRLESFLLAMPFFGLAIIYCFFTRVRASRSAGSVKGAIAAFGKQLIPIAAMAAVCAGLAVYDAVQWSQPEWKYWQECNHERSMIVDYPMPAYEEVSAQLTEMGISEVDYYMVTHWGTGDTEYFDLERLREIASLSVAHSPQEIAFGFIEYPLELPNGARLPVLLLVFTIGACLWGSGAQRITVVTLLFAAYCACSYFFGAGRLFDRVEYPILIYAATSIAFVASCPCREPALRRSMASRRFWQGVSFASVAAWLLVTIVILSRLMLAFSPVQVYESVHQQEQLSDSPLVEYVSDSEDVYVWDTFSYIFLELAYGYVNLPPEDVLEHNISLGGWTVNAPFINARNEEAGMANIVKGLVENDHAYFISAYTDMPDYLLRYIREHYYPNAKMERLDYLVGYSQDASFYIYRFTAE